MNSKFSKFADGEDVRVQGAIIRANNLKLMRYCDIDQSQYSTSKPYFAHLYWMIQHEFDMYLEYSQEGEIWIHEMTKANWMAVAKWLDDYSSIFIMSANRYDALDVHDKFGVSQWTGKDIGIFGE